MQTEKKLKPRQPNKKVIIKLSDKEVLNTLKSLVITVMHDYKEMDKRHNNIISLFKRDTLLWNKKKVNKLFVMPHKYKDTLPKEETLTLDFGSEAYFDIFFSHFDLILQERKSKRNQIINLLKNITKNL